MAGGHENFIKTLHTSGKEAFVLGFRVNVNLPDEIVITGPSKIPEIV
jgi:hypothetical protein